MALDPDPMRFMPIAYFAGGLAVWKLVSWLFVETEKQLSPSTRDSIALWLLAANTSEKIKDWPKTFAAVFDAVFTKRHFSSKCFFRSCLASISAVGILFVVYQFALRRDSIFSTWDFMLFAVCFNLLPDYFSLLQTRYLIRRMHNRSALAAVTFLFVDFVASTTIFSLGVPLGVLLLQLTIEPLAPFSALRLALLNWKFYWVGLPHYLLFDQDAAILLWSTYFTSVWIWVYAVSGLAVRSVQSLEFLSSKFDIENKPLSSIGYVAGCLAAFVWWALCFASIL